MTFTRAAALLLITLLAALAEAQVPPGTAFDRTIHVTVGRVEDLGSATIAYFGLGRHRGVGFSIALPPETGVEVGDRLELTWVEASLRLFDTATGEAIPM